VINKTNEEDFKKNDVKFSILTPCLNNAKSITKTIESIISQTYQNWEHIIVDGGSTDGTVDIIRNNMARYGNRLIFISEPDRGPNEAIRKGLRIISGKLVGFLGSDDWYENNALEIVKNAYSTAPNYDVYYGIVRVLNDKGTELFLHRISHHILTQESIRYPACFIDSSVYKRIEWNNHPKSITDDYAFLLELFFKGGSFLPLNNILVNFSSNGRSSKYILKGIIERIWLHQKHGIITKNQAYFRVYKILFKYSIRTIFIFFIRGFAALKKIC